MAERFDLVVIGTGTAASTVATRCRKAGWRVAIVDSRPYGGTCALRGCDPKKVLVGAAEAVDRVLQMSEKGVDAPELRIVWADLMRFKRSFTEPVPQKKEKSLQEAGIDTFFGRARFTGRRSVEVGRKTLEGRRIHIATGARPRTLQIPGEELLTSSDEFLELEELPARILFVGGGYISFEFAHVAATAGARVGILQRGGRPLSGFDPDLVDLLVKRTREMGVDLQVDCPVRAVEQWDGGLRVQAGSESDIRSFEADLVVHGAGRVPEIDELDLDAAGVEFDPEEGICVNAYMQSVSNPDVYAAGDAAQGSLALTPVAALEGKVAASNLLHGNRKKIDYPPVPSVVFTLPPLAMVGMQESEGSSRGLRFETHHAETSDWYFSRRLGEKHSGYKVLVEEETGRILGASLFGPHAEEGINLFAMAMRSGISGRNLKEMLFAYPTFASNLPYMV